MKPPICSVCGKRFDPPEGALLYFKKSPEDQAWDQKMRETGMVGHPPYAAWFCGEHSPAFSGLTHLTLPQARQTVRQQQADGQ